MHIKIKGAGQIVRDWPQRQNSQIVGILLSFFMLEHMDFQYAKKDRSTRHLSPPTMRRKCGKHKRLRRTRTRSTTNNIVIDAYPLPFPYHNDAIFLPVVETGRTRYDSPSLDGFPLPPRSHVLSSASSFRSASPSLASFSITSTRKCQSLDHPHFDSCLPSTSSSISNYRVSNSTSPLTTIAEHQESLARRDARRISAIRQSIFRSLVHREQGLSSRPLAILRSTSTNDCASSGDKVKPWYKDKPKALTDAVQIKRKRSRRRPFLLSILFSRTIFVRSPSTSLQTAAGSQVKECLSSAGDVAQKPENKTYLSLKATIGRPQNQRIHGSFLFYFACWTNLRHVFISAFPPGRITPVCIPLVYLAHHRAHLKLSMRGATHLRISPTASPSPSPSQLSFIHLEIYRLDAFLAKLPNEAPRTIANTTRIVITSYFITYPIRHRHKLNRPSNLFINFATCNFPLPESTCSLTTIEDCCTQCSPLAQEKDTKRTSDSTETSWAAQSPSTSPSPLNRLLKPAEEPNTTAGCSS